MRHEGGYSADTRVRWPEFLPWIVALAGFFLLPEYLSLGARILVYILYALSLDLILGYAGIITLGQSAYFGLGAYVAGILAAKAGITDPLVQLAAAGAAGALLGIGTAMVYPTLLAAIGDVAAPAWRASSVGVYRLWRDLGYALGALLAGVTADVVGLAGAMWVIAAITSASGLVAAVRLRETLRHATV